MSDSPLEPQPDAVPDVVMPGPFELRYQPVQAAREVSRVRVAGPAPFNSLVIVHGTNLLELPSFPDSFTPGDTVRMRGYFTTQFRLRGFDVDMEPLYAHSTAASMYLQEGSDSAEFTFAIDSVSGRFNENGRWVVESDLALALSSAAYESVTFSYVVSSYVLCIEPDAASG